MFKELTYKSMMIVICDYKNGKNNRTEEDIKATLDDFLTRDFLTQQMYDELYDTLIK